MKRFTIAALILFALGSCATHGDPVKLAYKFVKGDLDKYRVNMTINMTMPGLVPGGGVVKPISLGMEMVAHQRTLSVLPDGSARIKVTYSATKIKTINLPKVKQALIPKQTFSVVMKIAPDGRVLGIERVEKALAAVGLRNFDVSRLTNLMGQYALLPSEPIDVGANWKQNMPLPFGIGDMTIDSVLESYGKQIWSLTSAAINQKFSAHIDLGQIGNAIADLAPVDTRKRRMLSQLSGGLDLNGTTTFYFSPAIGKLLKGSGQAWAAITFGMPPEVVKHGAPPEIAIAMDIRMTISRFN
ncbi:MAG: hypothetical protein N3B12_07835 [Armatimonadetes bacterium]|nr:hypothetical protein [Armatimonadota bacterium]